MVIGILVITGVLCLGYFILIVFYSGLSTSASILWLLLGAALMTMAVGIRYYEKNPGRMPLWIPVSALTLAVSGLVVVLSVTTVIFVNVPELAAPGLDYVIVLGAKVRADGMSKTLIKRLDKAAEYIIENPDTILVLSGGQGADEPCSEAEAMNKYLLEKGVPAKQMLLETASTSTLENIAYSQLLIEQDRESRKNVFSRPPLADNDVVLIAPDKPVQIGIITNNFHLYRARLIAGKRGIGQAAGIAAGSDPVLLLHLSVRECIAILKDRLVGNI